MVNPMKTFRTVLLVGAAIFGSVIPSTALPFSVAYVDSLTGLEWAEVIASSGFSWNEVAAVCSTGAAAPCSANIGTAEFTGWTWATSSQVLNLFASSTDLTSEQLSDQDEQSAGSSWAPQFMSLFDPTYADSTSAMVAGLSSDGPDFDPTGAWTPYVSNAFDPFGDDAASRRRVVAKYWRTAAGVWLYRPTAQVPTPKTFWLLGLGLAILAVQAVFRQRSRVSSPIQ